MRTFSTINDVIAQLIEYEPALADLPYDALWQVVQACRTKRYENLLPEDIDGMLIAALAALEAQEAS